MKCSSGQTVDYPVTFSPQQNQDWPMPSLRPAVTSLSPCQSSSSKSRLQLAARRSLYTDWPLCMVRSCSQHRPQVSLRTHHTSAGINIWSLSTRFETIPVLGISKSGEPKRRPQVTFAAPIISLDYLMHMFVHTYMTPFDHLVLNTGIAPQLDSWTAINTGFQFRWPWMCQKCRHPVPSLFLHFEWARSLK